MERLSQHEFLTRPAKTSLINATLRVGMPNINIKGIFAAITVALGVCSGAAHASTLLGEDVTGALQFGSVPLNFYDSANGFVPSGYLNSSGSTTVTIADPAEEFGFIDGFSGIYSDFTNGSLIIDQVASSGSGGASNWSLVFTSSAFIGATFIKTSDAFSSGVVGTLLGDTFTVAFGGGSLSTGSNVATFSIETATAAVPLPASLPLFLGVLMAGAAVVRRKSRT
ncbi:hypothetical protein [Pacificoceanicola onchidii]|uniref:hypothetical protein n=1 Tax=Pacificoceanicola onchidii TaxID=2562685 RepID=UPI0010A6A450|nr:hypothetical protein [Pacificoceanicola onchidii]